MITEPPFRAEHVGSLLRPQEIKDARAKLEQNEISRADLKEIEDQAVSRAVHKQESLDSRSSRMGNIGAASGAAISSVTSMTSRLFQRRTSSALKAASRKRSRIVRPLNSDLSAAIR